MRACVRASDFCICGCVFVCMSVCGRVRVFFLCVWLYVRLRDFMCVFWADIQTVNDAGLPSVQLVETLTSRRGGGKLNRRFSEKLKKSPDEFRVVR